MNYLETNKIYLGDSKILLEKLKPHSIALSFWSPPYFVGKNYKKSLSFQSWRDLLKVVIELHNKILKPGGFLVINIADILCFEDSSIPRFQALNLSMQKCPVTKDMVLEAKSRFPDYNRYQLAKLLNCSEQTIDRRLRGNNIRGGKYQSQTRVKLVGGFLEEAAYKVGIFLYDKRVWVKDPTWANSKWTSNSLKAVSEYEDLYVFWKPGEYIIDKSKLTEREWNQWGLRGIWYINSVQRNNDHEAKFPVELAARVIRLYSTKGDTVLDPFIGSGTTAIAAIRESRNFIGIEKEKGYVKLANTNINDELRQLKLV